MTNDKGAEHEKRAREIVYKAIPDKTLFGLQDAIIRALKEAHADGRREAESEMKLKDAIAFACGYDSGREDLLAEVVPVLEWYEDESHYELSYVPKKGIIQLITKDKGKRARELLSKLTAEGKK